MSPVQVTLARLVLGAAVLTFVIYVQRQRLPSGGRLWAQLTLAALFGNAAPYLLFAVGEETVASSAAGIINCTTPIWTTVLAYAVGHDRALDGFRLFGLALGFGGALLIFSPWSGDTHIVSWGGLACLGASICYAMSFIYIDRFLANRGLSSTALAASQLAAAAGLMALYLPVGGTGPIALRTDVLLAIAILGVLGTGFAYGLNYRIIRDDGSVLASTVTYMLPVVAVLLGWVVLAEIPAGTQLAGMLIVLIGVALTRFPRIRTGD